jgi:RHS repeat-associated protein
VANWFGRRRGAGDTDGNGVLATSRSNYGRSLLLVTVAAILAVVLVLPSVAVTTSFALAANAPVLPAAPAPGAQEVTGPVGTLPDGAFPAGVNVVAELPKMRTANSRTYLTSTGSRVLMSYPGPVNYKDSSGAFQPIDDTATSASDGGWQNGANAFSATVPATLAQPVSITAAGSTLGLTLQGEASSSAPTAVTPPTSVSGSASKSIVSFAKPLPDTDMSYAFGNTGVDESLTLASTPTADTYTWSLSPSAGLTLEMNSSGSVSATDSSGATVMVVNAPSIKDSNNLVGPAPVMTLSPDGTDLSISLVPDEAWLSDSSRAYPVTVDPTVSIPNSGDECNLYQSVPNTSYCTGSTSYDVGDNIYTFNAHAMFNFNALTSTVPYDSLIQNANFDVYENGSANTTAIPISLGTVANKAWVSPTWNDYNPSAGQAWTTGGGDFTTTPETAAVNAGTANGWVGFNPVRQVQAWVNGEDLTGTGTPPPAVNQGFMLSSDGAANTIYITNWASSSTSQWPYLSVQYTPRAGTGSGLDVLKTQIDDKTSLGVNAANGDLSVDTSLFNINGVGLPVTVDQDYDSLGGTQTSMGTGGAAAWSLSPSFDQPQLNVKATYPGVVQLISSGGTNAVFTGGNIFGQFANSPPGLGATAGSTSSTTFAITFDQSGEVWNFSTISGSTTNYHLSNIKDRNGNTVTYNYNTAGTELTSVSDTLGRTIAIGYNSNNLVNAITDSSGRSISFGYANPSGSIYRLSTATYGGLTTTYGYDTNGNLNEITDPAGNITTMAYNSSQQVTSVTRVTNNSTLAGDTTTYSYSPGSAASPSAGVTTVTDPNSHATTYDYDPWDRVTSATDALGDAQASTFNAQSSPTELTNGLTQATNIVYDTNNNLNSITSPASGTGQTAAATTYAFNTPVSGGGAVTGGQYLASSSKDAQTNCASFTYDAEGNQTASYQGFAPGTNCDGQTTGTGVTSVLNAYQGDSGVSCTGAKPGELCKTTSRNGNVTNYAYDSSGQLTSITQPGGSCIAGSRTLCTTISYDGLTRVATVTDGKGQKSTYSYDKWDRITQILYNGTTTCSFSAGTCVQYTYDGDGNVLTRMDKTGTTTFVYDTLNRLVKEELPSGADACAGSSPAGITYTYDAASNMTATCDGGGTVTYAYDAANRNVGVATGSGSCTPGAIVQPCTSYVLDAAGQLKTINYPPSTSTTDSLTYNNAGNQTSEAVSDGGTSLLAVLNQYTSGTNDRQVQQSTFNFTNSLGFNYSYDSQNRLVGAAGVGTGSHSYTYGYDGDGNLITQSLAGFTGTYAYNANDELCWSLLGTSANGCATPPTGAVRYAYDGNGNQTTNTGGEAISYNSLNQTTSLAPAGGSSLSMAYTGTNSTQRTSAGSTTFANSIFGVAASTAGGTTTYFTRDANGRLNSILQGSSRYYVYYDGNGSVAGLINSLGVNEATYAYDPYGNTTPSGSSPSTDPFRYKGGYEDSTGLYKFGTRYYNPGLGSWTQQDSVPGGNRYAYADDNPVNEVDPSGLSSYDEILAYFTSQFVNGAQGVTTTENAIAYAQQEFGMLTANYPALVAITPPDYGGALGGVLLRLTDQVGVTIGLRLDGTTDGSPAIDFDGPGFKYTVHYTQVAEPA